MSYPTDRFGPSGPPENFFNTKDAEVLSSVQTAASDFRHWEMATHQKVIRGDYNADHFRATHAYVMQDTYPWAGQTRQDQNEGALRDRSSEATGNMLTFEKPQNVNTRLDELSGQLKQENNLKGLGKDAFVERLTHYYDQYNQVAPFRGGNNATLNTMTEQLAKEAGYTVDLGKAPRLSYEADLALQNGPNGSHKGLENELRKVTEPTPGKEAELLRHPALRELVPEPTRRSHEATNQREMLQSGAVIADQLGGRVGGYQQYSLLKQTIDEITSGNVNGQNLQVVKQITDSARTQGIDPKVIDRFEHSTANLAELKGYYQGPALTKMPESRGSQGRGSNDQERS